MNRPSTNETTVVADADVPTITITREFDAPPSAVFRAHTDPDLYARWSGPTSIVTTIDSWDCRTGGSWAFSQRLTERDGEFSFYGSFHHVREHESIVQTFTFADFPDGVSLERLTFTPLDEGRRTRLVATSLVDSFDTRDAMISSEMETGVVEGYIKLDAILTDGE